jgi:hypothetical protein
MGVVYACAFSFMSKYLHQSCGPKPMTRVDINDNNQSSNIETLVAHGYPIFNFLIFTIFILCNNEVSMDFFGAITNILNLFWMWVFETDSLDIFSHKKGSLVCGSLIQITIFMLGGMEMRHALIVNCKCLLSTLNNLW